MQSGLSLALKACEITWLHVNAYYVFHIVACLVPEPFVPVLFAGLFGCLSGGSPGSVSSRWSLWLLRWLRGCLQKSFGQVLHHPIATNNIPLPNACAPVTSWKLGHLPALTGSHLAAFLPPKDRPRSDCPQLPPYCHPHAKRRPVESKIFRPSVAIVVDKFYWPMATSAVFSTVTYITARNILQDNCSFEDLFQISNIFHRVSMFVNLCLPHLYLLVPYGF